MRRRVRVGVGGAGGAAGAGVGPGGDDRRADRDGGRAGRADRRPGAAAGAELAELLAAAVLGCPGHPAAVAAEEDWSAAGEAAGLAGGGAASGRRPRRGGRARAVFVYRLWGGPGRGGRGGGGAPSGARHPRRDHPGGRAPAAPPSLRLRMCHGRPGAGGGERAGGRRAEPASVRVQATCSHCLPPPTFRLVSSTCTSWANTTSVLISFSTSASASAVAASTPLTQPVEHSAPVTSAISVAARSTGTCWNTTGYTASARRFGP